MLCLGIPQGLDEEEPLQRGEEGAEEGRASPGTLRDETMAGNSNIADRGDVKQSAASRQGLDGVRKQKKSRVRGGEQTKNGGANGKKPGKRRGVDRGADAGGHRGGGKKAGKRKRFD